MYYSPTQEDISIIKQTEKDIYIKIELLNRQFKILESLEGNLINDNLSVDSESKQRRTYNCEMHVTDASFLIGNNKKIWIDKYIRVYYGIKSIRTKAIKWWLIGTFTYINVDYNYSAADNSISLSCGDLMSDYDGTKNGQIDGLSLLIPAGEDIRSSVIATLKDAGITNYIVEDIRKEIPYDLEFNDSKTYCDVWSKLCELYDSWEFYFDLDGTFIWRQIPTGLNSPVIADDSLFNDIYVDEKTSNTFSGIYNITEVWGKVLELDQNDRYANRSTLSGDTYSISLESVTNLSDINHLDQIGIKICADSPSNAKVAINNLGTIPIIHDDGSFIEAGTLKADTVYVFSFRRNLNDSIQNCLYLLGQYQAYGIYKETNPDCPFSVSNLGYEIINRVNYDNLYSDDLCYNQAEYLTYQTTAMKDVISLNLILIPWLDVNEKIKYTSKMTGETNQYMIKNFSWSGLSGTMSMTIYKFIESFSYVKQKQKEIIGRSIVNV